MFSFNASYFYLWQHANIHYWYFWQYGKLDSCYKTHLLDKIEEKYNFLLESMSQTTLDGVTAEERVQEREMESCLHHTDV